MLFDGGIRRGTEVLKALALGADAVLLHDEFIAAMVLCGARSVAELGPELLR